MKPEDIEREVEQFTVIFERSPSAANAFRSYLEEKGPLFTMWVKASDRMPTVNDSDASGDVVVFYNSTIGYLNHEEVNSYELWISPPNIDCEPFEKWLASQQFQVDDQTKEVMRKAFEAGKTQE